MRLIRKLLWSIRRGRNEAELREEMEFHLEAEAEDRESGGEPADEARQGARREFGNLAWVREEPRAVWGWTFVERLFQDFGFAVRLLRKRPLFTAAAVLTLALGVGVNGAMFSLLDHLMFRSRAHIVEPDRLVHVDNVSNYANFLNMRERSRSLDVAAYMATDLSVGRGIDAEPAAGEFVSHDYFDLLGARPIAGRWFSPDEETPQALSPVAVISHRFWQHRFDGDRSIVGQGIRIHNGVYTVVGVAPRAFTGAMADPVDVWLPIGLNDAIGRFDLLRPNGSWLRTIGRVRDDFAFESAVAESATVPLDTVPGIDALTAELSPFAERRFLRSNVSDRTIATWLAGAAGVLLLIAAVNVAGLLLVLNVERRREIALRVQLGAGRRRILRQLFSESLLLAGLCGIAAGFVAYASGPMVRRFFVPESAVGDVLDVRVAVATGVLALLASLLSAAVPAFDVMLIDMLRPVPGGRVGPRRPSRVRAVLLGTQVAGTLVLLVGAGLFGRSLERVRQVDFGFDPFDVLIVSGDLTRAGYATEEANEVYERLRDRVLEIPGVESAALNVSQPIGSGIAGGFFPPREAGYESLPVLHMATSDYLETVGTSVIAGRGFNAGDTAGATPVVIVTRETARRYWQGEDPIGRCLETMAASPCFTVVGVAEDTRPGPTTTRSPDQVFVTFSQGRSLFPSPLAIRGLYVRTEDSDDARNRVIAAIRSVEPDLPYLEARSLWTLMDGRTRAWRLGSSMFGLFAGLAVVLAGVGVYGVLAFAARQRTREVGIRMALGAMRSGVLGLFAREGAAIVVAGCLAGIVAAGLLTRFVEGLLFGVAPTDAATFASATLVIGVVAAVSFLAPAVHATRVDPSVALRHD